MKSIILVGYMGSGKTTIGRQLALALGRSFYDLDWFIETRYRRSVAQLFQERGEQGFRELEHNMLHEAAEFEDIVLSCGGGTPCFYDNMDYIRSVGESVYLKATPEVLAEHLKMRRVERPLLEGKSDEELLDFIRTSLHEREPFYLKAQHVIDVSLLDNYDKLQTSVKLIRKVLGI